MDVPLPESSLSYGSEMKAGFVRSLEVLKFDFRFSKTRKPLNLVFDHSKTL